jgi:branched-chain amino acid aminotransferase
MSGIVAWVDGRLRAPDEPALTVLDHGVTVGDGVFETCGVVQGRPFALRRHLARLVRSAAGIGLAEPDLDAVRDGIEVVLAAGEDLGRVRVTITAGVGPLGSGRLPSRQTVIVTAGPAAPPTPVRVVRAPWPRNERSAVAGLKTTSYVENVVLLAWAKANGGDEAVVANTVGDLCEGTATNVFVELGGELLTPSLSSGCLGGITRELVLEWSSDEGLPVREAAPGELPFAVLDEVMAGRGAMALAGSVRTVVPVVAVDGVDVSVGPLTGAVQRLYREREAADLDP